uniref:Actinoporin-like protein n=1 Tax=Oreochromis niloticus TaxID=8128 RepID=A0A669ECU3_ORENI
MGARQSAIHITNQAQGYTLQNPSLHLVSGLCQIPLPTKLEPFESGNALFSKIGGTARGTVGVFTYDLYDQSTNRADKKIGVMFSVPFDYGLYCNWYAVGVFGRTTNCDYDLYRKMYHNPERGFVRGKADGHDLTHTDINVTIKVSMTNLSVATLKVEVHNIQRGGLTAFRADLEKRLDHPLSVLFLLTLKLLIRINRYKLTKLTQGFPIFHRKWSSQHLHKRYRNSDEKSITIMVLGR